MEFPSDGHGADAWGFITGEDGLQYLGKGTRGGTLVPAYELIGTRVAEKCGLACPECTIIETATGELLFGSKWITGVAERTYTSSLLHGTIKVQPHSMSSCLSHVYPFDLFINNLDRHDRNYVFVVEAGVARMHLLDFGRSFLWSNSTDLLPSAVSNTRRYFKKFSSIHGIDLESAHSMLDTLSSLSVNFGIQTLDEIPGEWMSATHKQQMLDGWWREGKIRRIDAIIKGLRDGSLT